MFIENELAGGTISADEVLESGSKGSIKRKLMSILATCESLEQELANVKSGGQIQVEKQECCNRVAAVRKLAEAILEAGVE